ncbi:MAG: hypothetical protein K6C05_04495 [Anaerovibrio sp.]|uniref:hypothetical protein n=1 Tax=Anaerovibrio sp. TaxID=1872532 RepID=UPI0025DA1B99|nr:hypothetical protein [Anaerovibrio sp.]MCR5176089.1 hypothetical protein [Anaerovibrio sp.]
MIDSLHWPLVAEKTAEFIAMAKEFHLIDNEIIKQIEGRLQAESPFPIHNERKDKKCEK